MCGEENPGLIAGAQGWQAEDGNNAHLQVLGSCDGGEDCEERERAVIALIVVKTWIEIIVLTGIVNYKAYSNRMMKKLV